MPFEDETSPGVAASEAEFLAVVDDVMEALAHHGIGDQEKSEVLSILYSMKGDIIRV